MLLIWIKLKQARTLLRMTQAQAEQWSGVLQKDISLLESGKKEFIPNEYIRFLYQQGIDLGTLFDNSVTDVILRPDNPGCVTCKGKDQLIAALEKSISFLKTSNSALEDLLHEQALPKLLEGQKELLAMARRIESKMNQEQIEAGDTPMDQLKADLLRKGKTTGKGK